MTKAAKAAKQDIKAETALFWSQDTWDQWNVGVTHLFTRENRLLNEQLTTG